MIAKIQSFKTLTQPAIEQAEQNPEQLMVVFINEDGTEEAIYASSFHANAVVYAQTLQTLGVKMDDLVILVLRHSRELLSAFWGAMYLGAIPSIFPFLTEKLDPDIYLERVHTLVSHSRARVVVTFPEFKDQLQAVLDNVDCRILSTDDLPTDLDTTRPWTIEKDFPADKVAFLQHSSGTTGLQKGVALSHQAVLNQLGSYSQAIKLHPEDVIVSWLPLYHDMGLIAGFIMPIVMGVPLVLISPFHWVRDPKTLLWAIHHYEGTLSWLPNFAYNHCVRSIRRRDLDGLDLSSWRAVINCSEPVRHDSHQQFLDRFGPYGFRESALATCYAMAENTFAVTQSLLEQPPHVDWVHLAELQKNKQAVPIPPEASNATPMVSCGIPIQGTEVAVVNENHQPLPERHVGEVVIRGNSMLNEYYRRPDLSSQAIQDGWYYTGDMGYLAEGELYISGRKKDLIIVGGKNIYPQDLEAIANDVPGIHPGRAVAFGLLDERLGSESIVMVCELTNGAVDDTEKKQIEQELRRQIVQQNDVTLTDVRLVEKQWLLKTSSGKIARSTNRDKYLHEFRGR